jgi:hypothetical protein
MVGSRRLKSAVGLARSQPPAHEGLWGEIRVTARLELLNSETHKSIKMHAIGGTHPPFVMVTIGEFPAAAAVCPLFFAKDSETGEFYAGAMFGFQAGELLVEDADKRDALFRPLYLQRQGFLISEENIAVDLNDPRFAEGGSIALFEESGETTEAMRRVQWALGQLNAGVEATREFIRELLALKLIEPVDISLAFDDGQKLQLDGLYTVSRDALLELEDNQVLHLFRKGYLQAAYSMTFSLNQVAVLARRRNARLSAK